MTEDRPVLIAGAGIGGLTLALALARRGIPSVVAERVATPEQVGAGIQLSANAGHVLDGLGLGPAIDRIASDLQAITVADGRTGQAIARLPLGAPAEQRYGAPYRVLHRADLHTVLLDAAKTDPRITLRFGETVTGFYADGPALLTQNLAGEPQTIPGRLVVGADGVRSVIAAQLGIAPAIHSGLVAWRALLPADAEQNDVTRLWLRSGAHLVAYSVSGGRAHNLVLGLEGGATPNGQTVPPVREADWAEEPRRLIASAIGWLPWPLFVRQAEIGWAGPVTLLGDAVHPMLPFLAQGAALAIEDAAVLAAQLAGSGRPEAAARAYEAGRVRRWQRVQQAAANTGRLYHISRMGAPFRNLGLQLTPPSKRMSRFDWIYGWRPPA